MIYANQNDAHVLRFMTVSEIMYLIELWSPKHLDSKVRVGPAGFPRFFLLKD